jgi:hypothetical protein
MGTQEDRHAIEQIRLVDSLRPAAFISRNLGESLEALLADELVH